MYREGYLNDFSVLKGRMCQQMHIYILIVLVHSSYGWIIFGMVKQNIGPAMPLLIFIKLF